jgi:hypothetical protein
MALGSSGDVFAVVAGNIRPYNGSTGLLCQWDVGFNGVWGSSGSEVCCGQ